MRVGIGYDAHPLVSGRSLVLGGVHIPFEKGLSGHSDADVLTHAIIDALLGASGLKDIGTHFPSQDSRYKDISSLKLLDEVNKLVKAKGSRVGNIDATIVAQQPRLSDFIDNMRENISKTLGISQERVMVKATTTDGLGFPGREEGMAAYAVALVEENK
ncbi:MAG: 2-C-methyl-D-erythritol 2,4-cyclodiphosphate synthase [Chloroflexi bacterium]|nr:2-C-methyl-D-erythritol 2,4-cyclodiphosphate synthase [Chloroflexota bacterium]MBM3173202.1 2-C-methyl-D-erythritol 2,4-cyclodiphosphate synthase [Chloroflexota bacterium]MBM3174134.1 2-C-methyl-D-erythritol 2,4-cyclodiphosphate synthase [Chloroflexota bacterium]MBM4449202.1 2-C-methyl-D-erythritol 2,4-cyclodiphosphate synthase [Chloroflexota bacterium]